MINCTGPQARLNETDSPLLRNLLRRGHIRPDALNMGVDVEEGFSAVDARGRASSWLYAMGPLLKGTLWETIAVPELRVQAMRIAETLAGVLEPARLKKDYVLEYHI